MNRQTMPDEFRGPEYIAAEDTKKCVKRAG